MTAEIPQGAVVITTGDMYRQLLELTKVVGEVKGSLGFFKEAIKVVDDHEERIRVLERRLAVGVPVAGAAGIGGLVTALVQLFGG